MEKAAVVSRVAPSFLRIGSFQALNPPGQIFFLGGGQQAAADLEAPRVLGEYVRKHVLCLDEVEKGWAKKLIMECARRNAIMVAGWQAYGFMHSVINTDNVSIMGLTIDYGPYAFMDVYDSSHICNHSDDAGRYAFKFRPTMIIFALRCLLSALAPVEKSKGSAVLAGWSKDVSDKKISKWTESGLYIQEEMEKLTMDTFTNEYIRLMKKCSKPGEADDKDTNEWTQWLEVYAKRIEDDKSEWDRLGEGAEEGWLDTREKSMELANPRFILRQWLLEEVIAKVEKDPISGKRVLAKVMEMATRPFDRWGAEGILDKEISDDETKEERRFCGLGDQTMLSFQCSCSS